MKTLLERFMKKVSDNWQWIGGKNPDGYGFIHVGKKKNKGAHCVSFELFNGPIPPGMNVLHSCDDPGCVNPEHLHLGTLSQNTKEAYDRKRLTPLRGEKAGNAKLTEKQVLEIRRLVAEGNSQLSVAKQFGVSQGHVSLITNKKQWKDISCPT